MDGEYLEAAKGFGYAMAVDQVDEFVKAHSESVGDGVIKLEPLSSGLTIEVRAMLGRH